MAKTILLVIFSLFFIGFISALEPYSDCSVYGTCKEITTQISGGGNNITQYINNTYINQTITGANYTNYSYYNQTFLNQTYISVYENNTYINQTVFLNQTYYNNTYINQTNVGINANLTNVAFTNQSNDFGLFELTAAWFKGLFDWVVSPSKMATFNGSTLVLNDTYFYNMTVGTSGTGDNESWNQSFANTLYAGIVWNYNQTNNQYYYNQTQSVYFYNQTGIYNYNHSLINYYNSINTSYNSTYQTYAYNQTANQYYYNQSLGYATYGYTNNNILGNKTEINGYIALNNTDLQSYTNNNVLGNRTTSYKNLTEYSEISMNIIQGFNYSVLTSSHLDSGVVGWWRMDDLNSSGGVVDYMGRNNGSNVGGVAQVTNGKMGDAMSFDGSTGYVNIPYSSSFNFERNDSFSISSWIKADINNNNPVILGHGDGTGYYIEQNAGNTALTLRNTYGTNMIRVTTGSVFNGAWKHIVFTYNGSSNATGVRYYVNGVDTALSIATDNLVSTIKTGSAFQIGKSGSASTSLFNGSIDDVMIFNRSLNAAEVSSLYNSSQYALYKSNTGLIQTQNYTMYVQDYNGVLTTCTDNQCPSTLATIVNSTFNMSGTKIIANSLTIDTSTLVVNPINHRVGIGTATPLGGLDINGSDAFFGDTGNTARAFYFKRNNLNIGGISTTNGQFTLFGGSAVASHIIINGSGSVGMGTTTPRAKLDVAGEIRNSGNLNQTNGNATINMVYGEMNNWTILGYVATPVTGDVYNNFTNLAQDFSNAMYFSNSANANGGSKLMVQVAGVYDVYGKVTWAVQNGGTYGFGVVNNSQNPETTGDCYSQSDGFATGGKQSLSVACYYRLYAGDNITVVYDNQGASVKTLTVYKVELKAKRIGN